MTLLEKAGAVNAHTHLYSGLVPFDLPFQIPPTLPFPDILKTLWWRLDRALTPDILSAAARYYVGQALLYGTTTLVDHHESPTMIAGSLDILASACADLGIRAVLCYGVTERNFGREEAQAGLAECQRFLQTRPTGKIRGAVGVHAGFTVSDQTLTDAGNLARQFQVPVHIHAAEDTCDVDDARRRGDAGLLARFIRTRALSEGSILAHGVHLTNDEVRECDRLGMWLVNNPRSNENNRVGYAAALAKSRRVALGTDGFPSDMEAEKTCLAEQIKGADGIVVNPEVRLAAGRQIVRQIFGEKVLLSDRVIMRESPEGREVTAVEIGGERVVENGSLVYATWQSLVADAKRAAHVLWARMEDVQ
ncbi:MAG: amidohydrolase family protein [Polyangiaceae bacterium]|nr:amidohydrolase family protein [Polyangiaceae bacterium]